MAESGAQPDIDMGVQALYTLRRRLNDLHETFGMSWRKIAALDEYSGISHATLSAVAKGREPKNNDIRLRFGLSEIVEFEVHLNADGNLISMNARRK